MDLFKIIQDLREERKKLEQIIASLEELESSSISFAGSAEPRRGRRFMDSEARMEVSRRMKKYWAGRRSQNGADAPN